MFTQNTLMRNEVLKETIFSSSFQRVKGFLRNTLPDLLKRDTTEVLSGVTWRAPRLMVAEGITSRRLVSMRLKGPNTWVSGLRIWAWDVAAGNRRRMPMAAVR